MYAAPIGELFRRTPEGCPAAGNQNLMIQKKKKLLQVRLLENLLQLIFVSF